MSEGEIVETVDQLVVQIKTDESPKSQQAQKRPKPQPSDETFSSEYIPRKKKRKPYNPPKNPEFYSVTIPSMTLDDFRVHFRMSRSCLQSIMTRVGNKCRIFNMEKKFLFTILMLSSHESFYSIGCRFGMSKGSSHQYFIDVMEGLIVLFKEYVSWPSECELQHIEHGFSTKTGQHIPGIIGAINSCHFQIKKPARDSIYRNRKDTHSIIFQGVCDHQKIFTDVYVGAPGCLNAERVYNNSPLSKEIKKLIPDEYHLAGNISYPVKGNLIVPFLDYGILREPQYIFNECVTKANSIVSEAFQLLMARFRRLSFLDTTNPEMANKMIVACIIMHNHILMTDLDDDPQLFMNDPPDLILNEDPVGSMGASDDDVEGMAKRDYLMTLIKYN